MVKVILFSVFMAGFLSSCQSPKETHRVLSHHDYDMNELLLGTGGYMIATGDAHLTGLNYGGNTFFYRQNVTNPVELRLFGSAGQGPDEFIHPFSLQYLSDQTIGSYDMATGEYSELALQPNAEYLKSNKRLFTSDMNFKVVKTGNNQYIGFGASPDGMFILYDSQGNKIKSFFEFPYRDADEKNINNQLRAMAYQGNIATNISRTKLAYASKYADIVHFYNIADNDMQLIQKIETRFCDYVPDESGGGIGANVKPTNAFGYVDLYATDQYVYFLYSGKTVQDYKEKAFEGNLMKIYDWNGQLLQEIETDVPCKFFCVSPDDKIMWAIAEIPEPEIVRFDLER
jgi:hypothetical protein